MSWTDEAETMAKAWSEAQNKMWKHWYDWVQAAPTTNIFDSDLAAQWQKLAGQGLEAWLANAEPTAKEVAQRLLASQEALMHFLKFSGNAWQAVAAKVEAGEDWQSGLNGYMEQLRQEFIDLPQRMFKATQDSGELWRLYLEQVEKLSQPWLKSFQQASGQFGEATTGNGSALIELANLYWDAYERTFGRLTESPSLGYTRELDEKILKGFDAWQDYRQASFEYQIILAEAWVQVFEKLMMELVSLAEKGEAIRSLRELIDQWNRVADPVFIEIFRSEHYIRVQGRLVNTAMAYRLHQREIVELFMRISDLPTRSELDEAHRANYEQNKEIKALKKSLAEVTASMKAAAQTELEQSRNAVETLRREVKALQKSVAELSAAGQADNGPTRTEMEAAQQSIDGLRQEVTSLIQTVADLSAPAETRSSPKKSTARSGQSSGKRKRTTGTAKAKESDTEKGE